MKRFVAINLLSRFRTLHFRCVVSTQNVIEPLKLNYSVIPPRYTSLVLLNVLLRAGTLNTAHFDEFDCECMKSCGFLATPPQLASMSDCTVIAAVGVSSNSLLGRWHQKWRSLGASCIYASSLRCLRA